MTDESANPGHPAAEQCEGCTFYTTQVSELAYLHSRDITYAVFCQGRYDESIRYRDFMGWDMPWYSAYASTPTTSPLGPDRQWTSSLKAVRCDCGDYRRRGRDGPGPARGYRG